MVRDTVLLCSLIAFRTLLPSPAQGETYSLEEPTPQQRTYQVTTKLSVKGTLETALPEGKSVALPLTVNATLDYRERQLPGRGRDAQSLKSLRFYDVAEAAIQVRDDHISAKLRPARRLVVALGERDGIQQYATSGPLMFTETELLNTPGNSLALLGLLPPTEIQLGEKWQPESWVIQTLTGIEAAVKTELSCELVEVTGNSAQVHFEGKLEGAHVGATTEITLSGDFSFDLKTQHISRLDMKQTEKRAIGAVSPGLQIEATVSLKRSLQSSHGPLNDLAVSEIPLNPEPYHLKLELNTPWNVRLLHDRNWHVFKQTEQVTLMRLLERGNLISQFNLSKIPSVGPGKHTSVEKFQADIQTTLGETFREIVTAEELPISNDRFLFRVTVRGESNKRNILFMYYLLAGAKGDQVAFVFAVDEELVEELNGRDLEIVRSVEFLEAPKLTPVRP